MPRILVVDDEAFLRKTLSQSLGSLGYEVITAASGDEALSRLGETRPDLILTDVNMPQNERGAFIFGLRADRPEIPVIVMSGSISDDFAAYTRAGCWAVAKPFSISQLIQVLNRAISSRPGSA